MKHSRAEVDVPELLARSVEATQLRMPVLWLLRFDMVSLPLSLMWPSQLPVPRTTLGAGGHAQ
jgi:hypothetical protein